MKWFGGLMNVDVFIITKDVIKTSNEISFQWVVGSGIHNEIIYDLRVNDFVGILAKD